MLALLDFPSVIDAIGKSLVWELCKAHIAQDIKNLKMKGILSALIPGGLTTYALAGDIGIYKSFY